MNIEWTHPQALGRPDMKVKQHYTDHEFAGIQAIWHQYATPPVRGDNVEVFPAVTADILIIPVEMYGLIEEGLKQGRGRVTEWCKQNFYRWVSLSHNSLFYPNVELHLRSSSRS